MSQAIYVPVAAAGGKPIWTGNHNPFTQDNRVKAVSAGAAILYGAAYPTLSGVRKASQKTQVFYFAGDGNTTVFTTPAGVNAVDLPTTAAAALNAATFLNAVCIQYAQGNRANAVVLGRKGSDASPSTGEFNTGDVDNKTLTLGTAPAVGQVVELIIPEAIVQITGGAFTASREYEIPTYEFLIAGVAAVNLWQVGSR